MRISQREYSLGLNILCPQLKDVRYKQSPIENRRRRYRKGATDNTKRSIGLTVLPSGQRPSMRRPRPCMTSIQSSIFELQCREVLSRPVSLFSSLLIRGENPSLKSAGEGLGRQTRRLDVQRRSRKGNGICLGCPFMVQREMVSRNVGKLSQSRPRVHHCEQLSAQEEISIRSDVMHSGQAHCKRRTQQRASVCVQAG